jgi:phage terminase Nu1 subunit (DNA packaging protein)
MLKGAWFEAQSQHGRIVTKRALADSFNVSEDTLTQWQHEGLPILEAASKRGQSHRYDMAAVVRWMVKREIDSRVGEDSRERLNRLQGDKAELELKVARGELVNVKELEPAWSSAFIAIRSAMLAVPARLAQLLEVTPGVAQKRDLLSETFEDILTQLPQRPPFRRDEKAPS